MNDLKMKMLWQKRGKLWLCAVVPKRGKECHGKKIVII